jgi:hypothetical protein
MLPAPREGDVFVTLARSKLESVFRTGIDEPASVCTACSMTVVGNRFQAMPMSTKLSSVNPYLRDLVARKSMIIRSVVTSSATEGIRVVFKTPRKRADKSPVRERRLKQQKI